MKRWRGQTGGEGPPARTGAVATCGCGAVRVTTHGYLARMFCHCTICQRVNDAPFGDPVFSFRWQVELHDSAQVQWKRHTWNPINVNRGSCRTCGKLMIEYVALTPFAVVVGSSWEDQGQLPPARGHIFYDTRVEDIDDGLPKAHGYIASQLAVTRWALAGMFGR